MNKNMKTFLWGAGIAATGVTALSVTSYVFTQKMIRVALDREMPKHSEKSSKRLSGTVVNPDLKERARGKAVRLRDTVTKTVEITAYDGEKLVGHLYENKKAKRMIVAMHGWRSSWANDFGAISDFWHSHDCSVLYVEQRGQNNSGGNYMGFGLMERYDCLEWVKWINAYTEKTLPVYLAGISMGASTILMASGLSLPDNVAGIMADCGYTSPHAIWKHVVENNLHLYYGVMSSRADDMCKKRINMGAKEYSTLHAMKENTVPVLFIHGTDDSFVPVEMTYENYKACVAPKELLIVPGAGHGMSYLIDTENYEKVVMNFWEKYDFYLEDDEIVEKA